MVDPVRTIQTGALSDAIFSNDGSLVYAARGGTISAYSVASGTQTTSWTIGTQIGGMDITPDGHYLIATERTPGTLDTHGSGAWWDYTRPVSVYRIDLTTGVTQTFTTTATGYDLAFYDVAAVSNNLAVFSQDFAGSGWMTITSLDLTTGVFTKSTETYAQDGVFSVSGNHALTLYGPQNISDAPMFTVNSSGSVVSSHQWYADDVMGYNSGVQAISIAGNRIAQSIGQIILYDTQLHYITRSTGNYGLQGGFTGLAFSSDGTSLYALDDYDRLVLQLSSNDLHLIKAFAYDGTAATNPYGSGPNYGDRLSLNADGQHLGAITADGFKIIDVTSAGILLGTASADSLTGTADGDTIYGLAGDDVLSGAGGDDVLQGGQGNDTLDGGSGTDSAIFSGARSAYAAVVLANGDIRLSGPDGIDILRGVEQLRFSDRTYASSELAQLGTSAADDLTVAGNSVYVAGFDGNDTFHFARQIGVTLDGGGGDDVYYIDAASTLNVDLPTIVDSSGNDTIYITGTLTAYQLPAGIENGTAQGNSIVQLAGNELNNQLTGNDLNNILMGGAGDDTLKGGLGDDLLDGTVGNDVAVINATFANSAVSVLASGDIQIMSPDGTDLLRNITTIRFNDRDVPTSDYGIFGTTANDVLSGTALDDLMFGFSGNDVLNGGTGADTMVGGPGNDVYYVDNPNDVVTELPNAGFDRVISAITLTAPANTEALTLLEGASGVLTANATGTSLIGNSLANVLQGGAGADILTGGPGADTLTGGGGNDIFRDTAAGLNGDTIVDFSAADKIHITDASIANFTATISGQTLTYTGGSLTLTTPPLLGVSVRADPSGGVDLTVRSVGRVAAHDFDGDGKSDILWRNNAGQLSDWLGKANGSGGFGANDANAFTNVPTSWHVVGTGDFNGDGRGDLVWRSDAGQMSDWLGQANGGFVTNDANALSAVPTSWHIAGTGDFNGDGRSDILWRSDSGQMSDWLGQANGGFVTNDGNAFTTVPTNWHIAGTGDFNGDGRDDLLWRSDAGQLSDWLGQANGGFVGNDGNAFTSVPTNWHVAGTGDFNGDGRADILWRSDAGQLSDWLGQANGGFATNDGNAFTTVSTNWHVVETGDYNGDGRDDILWRSDMGQLSNWLGQANGGFIGNDANAFANVATNWATQPVHDLIV